MKHAKLLIPISVLIILLSLLVSILAVLPAEGETHTMVSQWGESVEIHGRGLYQRDSHSYAIQAIAQDWVTLILAIPLLIIALIFYLKKSFRGRLLLCGVLGYFLYTYSSYAFLMTYNQVFLIYVALFSLSLCGFIISFIEIDVSNIQSHVRSNFPVRSTSIFFIFISLMLTFMWLGRIIPSLTTGTAPIGLESYTTLVIQAMDLGIIVPLAMTASINLLKRKNLGYILSIIIALKGITLFSAVSMMAILMKINGIEINLIELIVFPIATIINFIFCFRILQSVK